MKYKKILLTGGTGKLGNTIIKSGYFHELLSPTKQILDIENPGSIEKFFNENEIDAIIHCAAAARMQECENNPIQALKTNIVGTSNLVIEVLKKEMKLQKKIRFIHISTDGVYPGIRGNYSEKSETIPYNKYGWSKLGAECAVNLLQNFCIIRTSFFDPHDIRFDKSATDAFSSKVTIDYLIKAISLMLNHAFVGTINIGSERKSDYERYKEFKPSLKPCKLNDIAKEISIPLAHDASLNRDLWKKIEQEIGKKDNVN